jgi:hypothetical protein
MNIFGRPRSSETRLGREGGRGHGHASRGSGSCRVVVIVDFFFELRFIGRRI